MGDYLRVTSTQGHRIFRRNWGSHTVVLHTSIEDWTILKQEPSSPGGWIQRHPVTPRPGRGGCAFQQISLKAVASHREESTTSISSTVSDPPRSHQT
jgi:hypothetical protein